MGPNEWAGMVIGGIAVAGGLVIGGIAIAVSVPWATREKMARLEAANKERLAMIEKGYDPETVFKQTKGAGSDPLLWGFLLTGLGFGILFGYILYVETGWSKEIMTNALGIGLGGVGLIAYHFYRRGRTPKPQQ